MLLLPSTGARHPYKIDEKYLKKRNVVVDDMDPYKISVSTLKDLIWKDWREGTFGTFVLLHIVDENWSLQHYFNMYLLAALAPATAHPWFVVNAIGHSSLPFLLSARYFHCTATMRASHGQSLTSLGAEWEPRPTSPSSIRLIHFGRMLDDKSPLKGMHHRSRFFVLAWLAPLLGILLHLVDPVQSMAYSAFSTAHLQTAILTNDRVPVPNRYAQCSSYDCQAARSR